MSIAGAVTAGRAAAEQLMVDTITFTADDGATTFDPDTGEYVTTPGTTLYSGKCQIQADTSPRAATVGEQLVVIDRITIKIPVGSPEIPPDSVGEITAVGDASDPGLVGKLYRVTGSHAKTFATARRLPAELVTT